MLDLSVAFGKPELTYSQLASLSPPCLPDNALSDPWRSFADAIPGRFGHDIRIPLLVRYVYTKQGLGFDYMIQTGC